MFFSPLAPRHQGLLHRRGHRIILPGNESGRGEGRLPPFQPMGMLISARSSVITTPFSLSFFKGHNRVFLIRRDARPIDADASLQELASRGRENKRKYSKERTRGRNFTILFPFSLFERTYSSLREEGFRVLSFVVVHFPFVEIYQWKL